jgi:hypothetical protein
LKYFLGSLLIEPLVTLMLAATRENEAGDLRQVDLWNGRNAVKPLGNDLPVGRDPKWKGP